MKNAPRPALTRRPRDLAPTRSTWRNPMHTLLTILLCWLIASAAGCGVYATARHFGWGGCRR